MITHTIDPTSYSRQDYITYLKDQYGDSYNDYNTDGLFSMWCRTMCYNNLISIVEECYNIPNSVTVSGEVIYFDSALNSEIIYKDEKGPSVKFAIFNSIADNPNLIEIKYNRDNNSIRVINYNNTNIIKYDIINV